MKSRNINLIILHCSDSDNFSHDNIETIRKWHTDRGFTGHDGIPNTNDDIGYHYFIDKLGRVFKGREEENIGAHCEGFNKESIGICLSGRFVFTEQQFISCAKLCDQLIEKYNLDLTDILEHRELDKHGKTCPNFNKQKIIERIYSKA